MTTMGIRTQLWIYQKVCMKVTTIMWIQRVFSGLFNGLIQNIGQGFDTSIMQHFVFVIITWLLVWIMTGFFSGYSTECENTFYQDSGTLTSPHYPHNYPNNYQSCLAEIKVPPGSVIRLHFVEFEVGQGDECYFDCVEVGQILGI